jgi:hypothetical protein
VTRRTYNFLGVRLTLSRYDDPARPAGAQLAVYRSVWLTCGRFAYGWIEARPWPMLQNLQMSIFGMLMETECGAFPVLPNQIISRAEPTYSDLDDPLSLKQYIPVRIESRNATPASGIVRLLGHYAGGDHTALWGAQRVFLAAPSCQIWIEPPIGRDAVCTHVEYQVEPNSNFQKEWQRYRGRPEWEE